MDENATKAAVNHAWTDKSLLTDKRMRPLQRIKLGLSAWIDCMMLCKEAVHFNYYSIDISHIAGIVEGSNIGMI